MVVTIREFVKRGQQLHFGYFFDRCSYQSRKFESLLHLRAPALELVVEILLGVSVGNDLASQPAAQHS